MGTTTDKLNKLLGTKEKIKTALEEKVDTEVSDVFSSYPALIETLPSSVKSKLSGNIASLFKGRSLQSLDLRGWDLSEVTNVAELCASTPITYANLSGLKLNVTDVPQLFYQCTSLKEVDVTDMVSDKLTSITVPFMGCSALTKIKGLDTWDTSKVTSMPSVFSGCSSLEELDLSSWDFTNCNTCSGFISGATNIKKLNLSNATGEFLYEVFNGTGGYSPPAMDELILRNIKYNTSYSISSALPNGNVTNIDVSNWTFPDNIRVYGIAMNRNMVNIVGLDTWNCKISSMATGNFFSNCPNLEAITGIENWDVSELTMITTMFNSCPKVKEVNIANWDTSNCTSIAQVFNNMSALEKVDVSGWTVNATVSSLATNCPKLSTIIFGEGWGKCATEAEGLGLNLSTLNSSGNDSYDAYQFSPETFDSMLKMYDRKANGLTTAFTITFNGATNLPAGWSDKMKAMGYTIDETQSSESYE